MTNSLKKSVAAAVATGTAYLTAVSPVFAQITTTEIDPGQGFASDIGTLINAVLSFVMVIAALSVFMYLIWGGIEWITSGGDKGKTESARNKITAAILGLVVLAASYAILLIALNFIGFDDLGEAFSNVKSIN
ncbi:MAG: hypothetical protein H6773_04530 [Pseudomonadales bacterium]|nr:hypothetical protein [Candidatus Woesebacteria bacterium]MCB9801423.1 hypothetical protein [Pseudomonadales bacterium]